MQIWQNLSDTHTRPNDSSIHGLSEDMHLRLCHRTKKTAVSGSRADEHANCHVPIGFLELSRAGNSERVRCSCSERRCFTIRWRSRARLGASAKAFL